MSHYDAYREIVAGILKVVNGTAEETQQYPNPVESNEKGSATALDALKPQNPKKRRRTKRTARFQHPLERTIQTIEMPRNVVDHSYNDLSAVPVDADYQFPSKIEDMSFVEKIHHMLSQENYRHCISWLPHGRAFLVAVPASFEKTVLPYYFDIARYSTFLRQLNNHGFKHITKGRDRNSYYHECMIRGMPHLSRNMPEPFNARRLIEDPENEPDFYKISAKYPLSDPLSLVGGGMPVQRTDSLQVQNQPAQNVQSPNNFETRFDATPPAKRLRLGGTMVQSNSSQNVQKPVAYPLHSSLKPSFSAVNNSESNFECTPYGKNPNDTAAAVLQAGNKGGMAVPQADQLQIAAHMCPSADPFFGTQVEFAMRLGGTGRTISPSDLNFFLNAMQKMN